MEWWHNPALVYFQFASNPSTTIPQICREWRSIFEHSASAATPKATLLRFALAINQKLTLPLMRLCPKNISSICLPNKQVKVSTYSLARNHRSAALRKSNWTQTIFKIKVHFCKKNRLRTDKHGTRIRVAKQKSTISSVLLVCKIEDFGKSPARHSPKKSSSDR